MGDTEQLLQWQIGAVTVTRLVEIDMAFAYNPDNPFIPGATAEALRKVPWLYPRFVTEADEMILSIHALLVETPSLRLVVDTCFGNGKPTTAHPEGLSTDFLERMAAAGWPPESVDVVICTHMHSDHVGWNTMQQDGRWVATFPNARYLFSQAEFDHSSASDNDYDRNILAASIRPVFDAGLADLVALDHVVCPEVRLIPTVGHSPGHVSVLIESEGARAAITGDMSHHPCQIAHPDWSSSYDNDPALAATTRASRFGEWADDDVLVIGTHYAAPTAGRIRREGKAYRFEA